MGRGIDWKSLYWDTIIYMGGFGLLAGHAAQSAFGSDMGFLGFMGGAAIGVLLASAKNLLGAGHDR